jgi:hypothetical protein
MQVKEGQIKDLTRAGAEAEILTEATRVTLSLMPSKATSQDSFTNKVVSIWSKTRRPVFARTITSFHVIDPHSQLSAAHSLFLSFPACNHQGQGPVSIQKALSPNQNIPTVPSHAWQGSLEESGG